MAILSNNTKAVLFNDNMLDIGMVQRSQCYVVQQYSFTLNRSRNATGTIYGFDSGSRIVLSIRVGANQSLTPFYQRLNSSDLAYFSFIFNARYDEMNIVEGYDSAILVSGYLVDISEDYERYTPNNEESAMNVRFCILIREVKYL